MSAQVTYPDTLGRWSDTEKITTDKILQGFNSGAFGGTGSGSGGLSGAGSPEGVKTANPGTTYYNTTDSSFWVKDSGVGTNTGWIPLII